MSSGDDMGFRDKGGSTKSLFVHRVLMHLRESYFSRFKLVGFVWVASFKDINRYQSEWVPHRYQSLSLVQNYWSRFLLSKLVSLTKGSPHL